MLMVLLAAAIASIAAAGAHAVLRGRADNPSPPQPRSTCGLVGSVADHSLRRRGAAVLLTVAAASWAVPAAAGAELDLGVFDDDGGYYEAPLEALAEEGVLAGTECGAYLICPDEPINRSTMAVWLVRAIEDEEPPAVHASRFADVNADSPWAAHIERVAELGITAGCGFEPLRYCPHERVTRAQMASLLARAFELPDAAPAGFSDTSGHIFEDQIDALAGAGITNGCASNPARFCPDRPVTRGQMAAFIARALGITGEPELDGPGTTIEAQQTSILATVAPLAGAASARRVELPLAQEAASQLAPLIVLPVDCQPPPLHAPNLLPNASRSYRSGTHQGVDFGCPRGRPVVAALDGRVVVAVGDYQDPSPGHRTAVLDTAASLGATPAYTLVMLYGNYVVIDHGIIDGVGHVVSIYAHLDALDPSVRISAPIEAGEPLGSVGNSGTRQAAAGNPNLQTHLHWELHVNGQYLGAGLSATDTRSVYATLFEHAS